MARKILVALAVLAVVLAVVAVSIEAHRGGGGSGMRGSGGMGGMGGGIAPTHNGNYNGNYDGHDGGCGNPSTEIIISANPFFDSDLSEWSVNGCLGIDMPLWQPDRPLCEDYEKRGYAMIHACQWGQTMGLYQNVDFTQYAGKGKFYWKFKLVGWDPDCLGITDRIIHNYIDGNGLYDGTNLNSQCVVGCNEYEFSFDITGYVSGGGIHTIRHNHQGSTCGGGNWWCGEHGVIDYSYVVFEPDNACRHMGGGNYDNGGNVGNVGNFG